MTLQNSKKRIILIILITILVILLYSCQNDPKAKIIERVYPAGSAPLSAYGWIGISFEETIDEESVQKAFALSPDVDGVTFWQEETFWFRPIQAYDKNSNYHARLSGEVKTSEGKSFNVDQTWTFTVREPLLLYYIPAVEGGEVWKSQADGSDAQQLTFTGNNVFEYSPDRTGETILFTVQNELGGRDLWLMNRDGEEQRLFLNCGQDLCSEPAWSTDGQTIAYTREVYLDDEGGYQPAQVWTADTESAQTAQLYQSDVAFGHSPSFSPDGKKLATYDTFNNGIRILDLTSSQESIIPTVIPGSGDWSPDGSKIIFTNLVAAENEPYVAVYTLDLETNDIQQVLSGGAGDTDFSQPRWSPDGDRVAVSLRPVNSNISKILWVLHLDNSLSRQISDDVSATFTAYQWDPWGDLLVYQRYDLSSANSSIWIWEAGENAQIVENGSRPQWLP
jgi:Tol biopolymer transport system component